MTQALKDRGWEPAFFAEVEAFPAGVLGQRFGATAPRHPLDPDSLPPKERLDWINNNRELERMSNWAFGDAVPNLGDFTKIDPAEWAHIEWLWGGTPCQAFSIAGGRQGLKDHRGNLALAFLGLAHELAATGSLRGFTWENVPGILSHKANPFGCFLGELVGHDAPIVSPHGKGRWTDFGVVVGPRARAAWRVLDTQHFGLPQRRRRLFVVASFGDGPDPLEILPEPKGLRRAAAPRAEPGEGIAAPLAAGTRGGSRYRLDADTTDNLVPVPRLYAAMPMNSGRDFTDREVPVTQPVMAAGPGLGDQGGDYVLQPLAFGGNNTSGPIEVATARSAHGGPHGRLDFESETFVDHERLSEPVAYDTTQVTSAANRSNPRAGDPCHPLTAQGHAPIIAFNARQDPDCRTGVAGPLDTDGYTNAIAYCPEVANTLKADGFDGSEDGTGRQPAMIAQAFSVRGRDGEAQIEPEASDVAPALRTGDGGSSKSFVATVADRVRWAVRRLTPVECERLQGTADNFTRIRWRNKPEALCPDGPRYKVIGNSMSVDVIVWLGDRIHAACRKADT